MGNVGNAVDMEVDESVVENDESLKTIQEDSNTRIDTREEIGDVDMSPASPSVKLESNVGMNASACSWQLNNPDAILHFAHTRRMWTMYTDLGLSLQFPYFLSMKRAFTRRKGSIFSRLS